ncbi:MAG TPA: hypothetical protein VMK82_04175 [Steroidobacteraceae bacterium]|nr:hypothetical protein [Steroidobacteraceae bacterium]
MDIELKLREMLDLRDPGVRFTDDVLSRVGDVPNGQSVEGVVRLDDVRTSRRGRRILLGSLVVVGAAAAALPFMLDRTVPAAPMVQQAVSPAEPAGESPAVDSGVSVVLSDPSSDVGSALDCIDPDVLRGLLLVGPHSETFRITPKPPQELATFAPPRQLVWLGATERGADGLTQASAVYQTQLAPEAARAAAVGALTAGGWKLQSDGRPYTNVFMSANSGPVGATYCREGSPVSLMANALDGVTYVVLSATRTDRAAGFTNACEQPVQPMVRMTSPLDEYMPTLELPRDPATGQPVPILGGGGGGGGEAKRRASAGFKVKDSVDSVARHFASQMAGQGWHADTNWSGTGTAGSTWTRRLDDDTVLEAMLAVSAFADDRFTAVFRAASTK